MESPRLPHRPHWSPEPELSRIDAKVAVLSRLRPSERSASHNYVASVRPRASPFVPEPLPVSSSPFHFLFPLLCGLAVVQPCALCGIEPCSFVVPVAPVTVSEPEVQWTCFVGFIFNHSLF